MRWLTSGSGRLTVSRSAPDWERQLRMQPRQKQWSHPIRPNFRCSGGLLMTTWPAELLLSTQVTTSHTHVRPASAAPSTASQRFAPHQTKFPLLWRLAHDHLASRAPSQHTGDYITYPCAPSIGRSILSISAVWASPLSTYHLCGAGQTHLQADAALHLRTDAAA